MVQDTRRIVKVGVTNTMVNSSRSFQVWLLVSWFLLVPILVQAQAAPSACDPSIRQNLNHPQGYRDREGQLCEGIYVTGVSSMGLALASFTSSMQGIDMSRTSHLRFQWQPIGEGEIRVRAESLRPRFYYRMDALPPANETHLIWSNAIPAQYELRTSEFGVLATQKDSSGSLIYLPLSISQDDQSSPEGPYLVTVISGIEIEEIYWSLAREGNDVHIVYDKPLERKPYVANQPIAIQLDQVLAPGSYRLTISADLRGGLTDSLTIRFNH